MFGNPKRYWAKDSDVASINCDKCGDKLHRGIDMDSAFCSNCDGVVSVKKCCPSCGSNSEKEVRVRNSLPAVYEE